MKKVVALCLSALLLFTFAACEKAPVEREAYTGIWLDKSTATKQPGSEPHNFDITEIYIDCFFATYENNTYKINATLPEDLCIGDGAYVTYDLVYWDEATNRREIDPLEVFPIYPAAKPVIYLYPTEVTDVTVTLTLDGHLTCTYPAYNDGWQVTAAPDGTLTDASGQTYNYLYWEGLTATDWDMTRGYCVRGEDTAAFLEDALKMLGLTRREANEFIVYWLPLMQENPYNVIAFQTECYTESAKLDISPAPDTVIRVFMAFAPSDTYVELAPQELTAPTRTGFTVVEWGGTALHEP